MTICNTSCIVDWIFRILDNALPLAKADQHGANFGIANVADDWDDVGIIMISELKETTEVCVEKNCQNNLKTIGIMINFELTLL